MFPEAVAVRNGGRRSTFGSTVNVIDFAAIWRETVSLLDVTWPRSNQSERALLGKNFQLYSN